MAKHARNCVLFVTAISFSAILLSAAPAGANPGFAGEQPPGVGDAVTNLVNGLLDVLGLRGDATTAAPATGSASRSATGSTAGSANGCAPASATASGDCPSATRIASTGGTAVASEPIAPVVQASTATPARLAFTGWHTGQLALLACGLMIAGFALVRVGRTSAAPGAVASA